jgi:Tol biopolymer transport system component
MQPFPLPTAVLLLFVTTLTAQGPHRCASRAANGDLANSSSRHSVCSADARFVAFASLADNLVPGDTNGNEDVFVRDMLLGTIQRVSTYPNGSEAPGPSVEPRITPDGRYVVFVTAVGLDPFDSNGTWDVYRADRSTGSVVLASCSSLGLCGNSISGAATISDDGRYVAFESMAGNLTPNDGNGATDVFVKDLVLGTTELISRNPAGAAGNLASFGTAIAGNGRFVAFGSHATDLLAGDGNGCADVFVRDRQTGALTCCSRGPNSVLGNAGSDVQDITPDGSLVLWRSTATNLAAGATNGMPHLFVSSPLGTNTTLVSCATNGTQADNASAHGRLSADGRWVVFSTAAANLVPGFGNWWTNVATVMRRDLVAGTTTAAAKNLGGNAPRTDCADPSVSADGRLVVFTTQSMDVIEGIDGMHAMVVVADQQPAVVATFTLAGAGCAGSSGTPTLDRDPETLPWTGASFRLTGSGSPIGYGLLALGSSGLPVPLPLDGLGLPGCSVTATVDVTALLASTPYTPWTATLAVPADPNLRGLPLWFRAMQFDPWANAFGAALSNGAQATIGW